MPWCNHGVRLYPLVVQDPDYAIGKSLHGEMDSFAPPQAMAFVSPQWFGADVTEDGRYKNKSLAENGIPRN